MKKLIFLLLVLVGDNLWSQSAGYNEKEYFSYAEYFFFQEYYIDALTDFLEVYKHENQGNAYLNYLIGVCYLNIPGQKEKSIDFFEKAKHNVSSKCKRNSLQELYAPIDLYHYLGNAYRINKQFDKAEIAYIKFRDLAGTRYPNEVSCVEMQICACVNAKLMMEDSLQIKIMNLDAPINNKYANFNPVISGDGSTMIYMTRLPFYDAVFLSTRISDKWSEPRNITPEIQSDGDQYVCDISYDGKELLLTREIDNNSDIYISTIKADGSWCKSVKLDGINTQFWESHASFSKDANTIYFSSNRNDGKGGIDIFKAHKLTDGSWGEIKNIDAPVNTGLNEDMPFITKDGTKLYFSAQSKNTIGGYDIFISEIQLDGSWGEPRNIGCPFNTPDDDLFFYPYKNGCQPYFFRFQTNGRRDYDIVTIEVENTLMGDPVAVQKD